MKTNAILRVKLEAKDIFFDFSTRAQLDFNKFGANIKFFTLEEGLHFENAIAVGNDKLAIYKGLSKKQDLESIPQWVTPLNLRLMQQGRVVMIDKSTETYETFAKYGSTKIGLNGKHLEIKKSEEEICIDFKKVSVKTQEKGSLASLSLQCFKI